MYILGISAYYHDSAACLLKDGQIVAAIEEERFSRIKHDNAFPYQAIDFCLKKAGISSVEVDFVSYYEKPLLKFERILETFVDSYPSSLLPFLKGMPEWLDYKLKVEQTIRKLWFKKKIFFTPHHLSHAAAAFYPSPFTKAAILTIDGVGEWQTTGLWKGNGKNIDLMKLTNFPDSLGLLYSTFTAYLGFKVNEDEYKLMGLAAYGKPIYKSKIQSIVDVRQDGSFKMDMDYFGFRESFSMYNARFIKLFGPSREPRNKIIKRHADIAASIQALTEDIYFKILNHLYFLTKTDNLCLSGGVALNALANGKIYKNTPFKNVYVLGAAGDSGAAFGSALFTHVNILGNGRGRKATIKTLYFGSDYSDNQISNCLRRHSLKYKKFTDDHELIRQTATLLAKGKIVGWFQDRCEYGPRALGARSILSKPNPRRMKTKMNLIKLREQFRPFAGSILQDKVHQYFDVPEKNAWSPFMTFCFPVKKEKRRDLAAIVHADSSCRIQTVSKDNGRYFALVDEFYKQTGIPCVLNTSFNLKGEPIVETPEQAIGDFMKTKMDCLIIGNFLVSKSSDKG
ncbi:carbamoyltransferase [Patescibacteria group bacterium]|nr:carbamoyltransferase [Patescibacteria group bacterium]